MRAELRELYLEIRDEILKARRKWRAGEKNRCEVVQVMNYMKIGGDRAEGGSMGSGLDSYMRGISERRPLQNASFEKEILLLRKIGIKAT